MQKSRLNSPHTGSSLTDSTLPRVKIRFTVHHSVEHNENTPIISLKSKPTKNSDDKIYAIFQCVGVFHIITPSTKML